MGVLALIEEFIKPISFAVIMALCVLGGWKLNTYYTGYQSSLEQKVQKKVDDAMNQMQADQAKNLVETQQLIKDNAKVIETKVPVIVERKVYQNVCLDEDGWNVLKELKDNSSKGRENIK